MEKFWAGKLNDDDGEKEDSAAAAPAVIALDKKVGQNSPHFVNAYCI